MYSTEVMRQCQPRLLSAVWTELQVPKDEAAALAVVHLVDLQRKRVAARYVEVYHADGAGDAHPVPQR